MTTRRRNREYQPGDYVRVSCLPPVLGVVSEFKPETERQEPRVLLETEYGPVEYSAWVVSPVRKRSRLEE